MIFTWIHSLKESTVKIRSAKQLTDRVSSCCNNLFNTFFEIPDSPYGAEVFLGKLLVSCSVVIHELKYTIRWAKVGKCEP